MLTLHPHPSEPAPVVQALHATLARSAAGGWQLLFVLQANRTDLRIPAPAPARAADGLWQHTCFELFVGVTGEQAYREFNFSPSSQWAGYAFSTYRERLPWSPAYPPVIQVCQDAGELRLSAQVAAQDWPVPAPGQGWRAGLTAVLEAHDGSLSYWALHHPGPRPDFHHLDGFTHAIRP